MQGIYFMSLLTVLALLPAVCTWFHYYRISWEWTCKLKVIPKRSLKAKDKPGQPLKAEPESYSVIGQTQTVFLDKEVIAGGASSYQSVLTSPKEEMKEEMIEIPLGPIRAVSDIEPEDIPEPEPIREVIIWEEAEAYYETLPDIPMEEPVDTPSAFSMRDLVHLAHVLEKKNPTGEEVKQAGKTLSDLGDTDLFEFLASQEENQGRVSLLLDSQVTDFQEDEPLF